MNNFTIKKTLLDRNYWQSFAAQYWERRPQLAELHAKDQILTLDAEAIFRMLVEYSNHCRRTKTVEGLKLFVDGVRQYDEEVLQILPTKKDKSLLGYHSRISQIYPDYCLVCDELLQVSGEHWQALNQFAGGLFEQIGLPYRFAEMGLYLGNYRKTPFGVHVDGCGVFSFPVVGEKKFRLWTPDYADKNPKLKEAFKYSKYIEDSELMTVRPGQMSYWPSSAWHIAESDGAFSATWSLGVWVDRHREDFVREALDSLLAQVTSGGATATRSTQNKNLPDELKVAVSQLKSISRQNLQHELEKSWLRHLSKQGFKTGPVHKGGLKVSFVSKLRGQIAQPIFYLSDKVSDNLVMAFAGNIFESAHGACLIKLIEALNEGQICKPKEHLSQVQFKRQRSALAWLSQIGAFHLA